MILLRIEVAGDRVLDRKQGAWRDPHFFIHIIVVSSKGNLANANDTGDSETRECVKPVKVNNISP